MTAQIAKKIETTARSRSPQRSAATTTVKALSLAACLLAARQASAQYGGGPGQPGGGMPAPPMGQEPKEEGPAEAAPEEEHPSDLEPLPGYAEQQRKRIQIVELNGYIRLRGDYLHNFFLGQGYLANQRVPPPGGGASVNGTPPFPVPLGCPTPASDLNAAKGNCGTKGMGAANTRLRLEPTINVTDQVRVHAQIDILDNTILGSTPDSLVGTTRPSNNPAGQAPAPFFYTMQDPPEIGQNGYMSSIRAKRAWGEIDSEFGTLRFGRMPWNWGRGIYYNDGSCADCDLGTTVDRVLVTTQLYGHQITASYDFGATGLTTNQINLGRDSPSAYPIDLSQDDDVVQFMASVAKLDNPIQLKERIDRGDLVVNYGAQVVYRSQQSELPLTVDGDMTTVSSNPATGGAPTREQLAPLPLKAYGALSVTPDLWLKLYFRSLTIEMEGVGVFGKIDQPGILAAAGNARLTLRQFGWVVASEVKLYRDALYIGFETGGATGDQAETRTGYLNYRWKFVQQPPGDTRINDFKFSPEYHIDEILWRQIYGTVTNAVYFKPKVAYWFDLQQNRQIGLMGAVIYSMAMVPVSTPGNSLSYGIEMNVGATYRNTAEGFYAGVTWGVLWPLAALDRLPVDVWGTDAADATAAQVVRTFLGIKF
jgi:uncharacterized protein (TIGR04551 family)